MKLWVVPLWSAYKELSNDVLKMIFHVDHIFGQKSHSTKGYNPWFFMILVQNSTYSKMDVIGMLHSC